MQQHIPAWKRIGLKLKYAKDSAPSPYQNDAEPEIIKTSNHNHEPNETTKSNDLDDVRPPKKRKLLPDPAAPRIKGKQTSTSVLINNSIKAERLEEEEPEQPGWEKLNEEHDQESSGGLSTRLVQQSRRKSVTFTPETKQEDGFSASNISKQWFQSQSSGQSDTSSLQRQPAPSSGDEKRKKTKKKRSGETDDTEPDRLQSTESSGSPPRGLGISSGPAEGTQSTANNSGSEETGETKASKKNKRRDKSSESKAITSCIEYLQQFSQDRATWRFKKHKQTVLLKHLFDVRLIPPKHNPVILEYIAGLQGGAARQRLIETATGILRSVAEKQDDFNMQSMESEEARRRAYADALKKEIMRYERTNAEPSEYDDEHLADMKEEIERGQRAEGVLFELLQQELHPEQHVPAGATSQRQAKSIYLNDNNKREASMSTATEGSPATGLKRKKRKTRTAASSSDSSSSSSDTDSDDDSERRTTPSSGPKSLREALAVTPDFNSMTASSKSTKPSATGKGKRTFFDDDLLDRKFPQEKSYHEMAPKRKAKKSGRMEKGRGFHYTHGALADESGSESE